MRVLILGLLVLLGFAANAHSAIIVSVSQATPGPIPLGSSAVFNIFARSDATITNFAGLDFDIAVPATGGTFVSGTSPFFGGTGFIPGFLPGQFAAFTGGPKNGSTLTNLDTIMATITLDTTGATVGMYAMSLTGVLALDDDSEVIPSTATGVNYTIGVAAVPEPGTIALLGLAAVLSRFRSTRKRS